MRALLYVYGTVTLAMSAAVALCIPAAFERAAELPHGIGTAGLLAVCFAPVSGWTVGASFIWAAVTYPKRQERRARGR
jgi:hypothetical protein